LLVQGKRYRFYGEKEVKAFKGNVEKYMKDVIIKTPPPRIMFIGIRGCGVTTQLTKLNEKYKISFLELKKCFLKVLAQEKLKRKNERKLNKGFKAPELNEEGEVIEDPEILEEAADFDKKKHEIEMFKYVFEEVKEIFIEGMFFDVDEETVFFQIIKNFNENKF